MGTSSAPPGHIRIFRTGVRRVFPSAVYRRAPSKLCARVRPNQNSNPRCSTLLELPLPFSEPALSAEPGPTAGRCPPHAKRKDITTEGRTPGEVINSVQQRQYNKQVGKSRPVSSFDSPDPLRVSPRPPDPPVCGKAKAESPEHYSDQIQIGVTVTCPVTTCQDTAEDGDSHQRIRHSVDWAPKRDSASLSLANSPSTPSTVVATSSSTAAAGGANTGNGEQPCTQRPSAAPANVT